MTNDAEKVYALNLFDVADREEYLASRAGRPARWPGTEDAWWPWAGSGRA